MSENSRWQDLFLFLEAAGFDVYSPSTKQGECKDPYLVIKNGGSAVYPNASSDVDLYDIMCYVPQKRYSQLEVLVQEVKEAMVGLKPMFLPYGLQTPSFYDDGVKAHMVSITYKNYKMQHRL